MLRIYARQEKSITPETIETKLNGDDLKNKAHHKLNQYPDELDRMINRSFISNQISWFTYLQQ